MLKPVETHQTHPLHTHVHTYVHTYIITYTGIPKGLPVPDQEAQTRREPPDTQCMYIHRYIDTYIHT